MCREPSGAVGLGCASPAAELAELISGPSVDLSSTPGRRLRVVVEVKTAGWVRLSDASVCGRVMTVGAVPAILLASAMLVGTR